MDNKIFISWSKNKSKQLAEDNREKRRRFRTVRIKSAD